MSKIIHDLAVLSKPSMLVQPNEVCGLAAQLQAELGQQPNGFGLSAVQIGIHKCIAVIKRKNGEYIVLVNPVIIECEDEFVFDGEGCLSFPGRYCMTTRYRQITITNDVLDGDKFRIEKLCFYYDDTVKHKDVECLAVQHEIDHMLGKTMFDREVHLKPVTVTAKTGRNEPCPCGRKDDNDKPIKYKKCCGA